MSPLENKVAIVTGASASIGRATSRLFTKEGATVVVAAGEFASTPEELEFLDGGVSISRV